MGSPLLWLPVLTTWLPMALLVVCTPLPLLPMLLVMLLATFPMPVLLLTPTVPLFLLMSLLLLLPVLTIWPPRLPLVGNQLGHLEQESFSHPLLFISSKGV